MFIKQIIIQGFKSYKDQTVIEPFSPKHNVIVGRNGSGKSNFFAAIRFALSDAYTQMSREERQGLLHEGAGSAVMSAYVEIIFDNSDDRFHTGQPELILRRTIGQKKDEYSLDRKNATKNDVMSLFDSAGFSRSNPYYIVPQGRVTALTNMKDAERLALLKEVAGTQVYEARRTESMKIMSETDTKRTKIDELLQYIGERLSELDEDKKELQEYRDKDRERRCLEYTLYRREQEAITENMEQLDGQRESGKDEVERNQERAVKLNRALSKIDEEEKDLRQKIDLLHLDKKQFSAERGEVARARAKVELDVNNATSGHGAAQSAQAERQKDLRQVQADIQNREAQLRTILPDYNKARTQEEAAKAKFDDADSRRQRLYAKQGRSHTYKSKKERDAYLQNEISTISETLAVRKAVSMQTNEDIAELEGGIRESEAALTRLRAELDGHNSSVELVESTVRDAKVARQALDDQRKELWREEARLDSVMGNTRQEMSKAEKNLSTMMDQNTSRGIAAVRRIAKQHNLDGVYGTVAELFQVADRYRTAVEVTANNSLFHYVVDNDETATQVLDILNREQAGRVTFMPLNRLHPRTANLPQAGDAIDMMTKLQYDPKYEKALRQIFGRTIICPNIEIASQYARSHGVDAITPGGDRSDKKGALTGGYHDSTRSRIEAVQKLAGYRAQYEEKRSRGDEIKSEVDRLNQQITRAMTEVQKAEQTLQQSENSYAGMQQEVRRRTIDLQSKRDALDAKQRARLNQDEAVKALSVQQSDHEAEMASAFKKDLSNEEEQQLESLSTSIPGLRKQQLEASKTRAELELQKSTLEAELQQSLRPRFDQLQINDGDSVGSSVVNGLRDLQKDLKRMNKKVEEADARLNETEGILEESTVKLSELEQGQIKNRSQLEEVTKAIDGYQRKSEKTMAKKALLTAQAEDVNKRVRELGALPDEASDKKYARLPSDQAHKRLRGVKEALKKNSHVNKKAFEQYSNFTAQRKELTKRRADLDTSQASIKELVDILDQRKDEAIERTFKQVSKAFYDIFERLVPAGCGRLIIQRRNDRNRMEEDEDEAGNGRSDGVENYTGVGIAVSFNSKHDEQQRIQQLSGGQKSLCALGLVFAIQQCDPAPFYLFDEIDANLDAQYRTAVANLLEEHSMTGQFICTTFRPEMVHVAEKCYGVSYNNKTSTIDVVNKEDALNFVDGMVGGH